MYVYVRLSNKWIGGGEEWLEEVKSNMFGKMVTTEGDLNYVTPVGNKSRKIAVERLLKTTCLFRQVEGSYVRGLNFEKKPLEEI